MEKASLSSFDFDKALSRILINRGLPDSLYITDKMVARIATGERSPSHGATIKAWWHMGGAITKGHIIVNSTVPATRYKVLRVEDAALYPHRAVCCVKMDEGELASG